MAKPNTLYRLTSTILIFLIISHSSSARPLNGLNPSAQLPENLALPGEHRGGPSEKDSSQQVFPCEMESDQNSGSEFAPAARTRLGGRYGPLFLSMLPKGSSIPPSGPSKGTNDENN
ncbi:uncharacterized protein LOC131320628 [Rhododendron vialii]|uniref:uncharacterized protein LOC131320628 n=1 Tax=Rhododendron vialii TaxID=182163 RepID=UPI00265DC2E2|nr:uncharacterized protein LOC131320628 [Rhododendron vialii]